MAFPGTYDINYYKGDTLEFRIYPKDSNGDAFPLSQYVSPNGVTRFTIATGKGVTEGNINGYAKISNDQQYILCAITPANGALMTAGVDYVYDVEIARTNAPYDFVYTLLKGSINVEEQVTPVTDFSELSPPNNATDLTYTTTADSISIGWTAPAEGADPTGYKLYIIPYTTDLATILAAFQADPFDEVTSEIDSYTFTGLDTLAGYLVGVLAFNDIGDAPIVDGTTPLILSNLLTGPIITAPEGS